MASMNTDRSSFLASTVPGDVKPALANAARSSLLDSRRYSESQETTRVVPILSIK